ncbi:MAG: OmpA family protein [Marinovum sp.]|nr:OmpA family protein [Marinovum sp.]
MSSDPNASQLTLPPLPRRAFLSAAFSAITVGIAGGAAWMGRQTLAQTESFAFARGTSLANGEKARLRAWLLQAAQDQRFIVTILGHTGSQGDAAANLALSEKRAALAAQIAQDLGVPLENITASGIGGAAPFDKEDGQGDRAYQAALARVEVSLQRRR